MQTTKFLELDCVQFANAALSLLVTCSVGPRILSLRFNGGDNLFAELPDTVTVRPDGQIYHVYGGHRLWHAPEQLQRTYTPDDQPVDILLTGEGLSVKQPVEAGTGIEKSLHISLVGEKPRVVLRHTLTNRGPWPVECAPWAITQLKTGGVAILPQSREQAGLLPNRALAIWPYTDISSPRLSLGNCYILVRVEMERSFKLGFPNPRGWLAYWLEGTLFVKRAAFDPQAEYYDFGSSSEFYCNDRFLELETLAPVSRLAPGESVTHVETWELYADVDFPADGSAVQGIVDKLGLE